MLRGLDVLLMLFVNEMAGVEGTPGWLLHTPARNDGMTITDTVFPAFLFITGMSIPLALGVRIARGDAPAALWRHVLVRSLSLIVLGVFMVNAEHGAVAGVFSPDAWNVLMTLAAFLVWQAPASTDGARRWAVARALGVVALVALAFLYRSADATGAIQMRPHWWGILGLIGWAYLVAASAFLLIGARPGRLLCRGGRALRALLSRSDRRRALARVVPGRPERRRGAGIAGRARPLRNGADRVVRAGAGSRDGAARGVAAQRPVRRDARSPPVSRCISSRTSARSSGSARSWRRRRGA